MPRVASQGWCSMAEEAPQGGGTAPEQPAAQPAVEPTGAAPAPEVPAAAAAPAPTPTPEPAPVVAAAPVAAPEPAPVAAGAAADAPADDAEENPFGGLDQTSIDDLLRQASFDDPASAAAVAASSGASATAVAELPDTSSI